MSAYHDHLMVTRWTPDCHPMPPDAPPIAIDWHARGMVRQVGIIHRDLKGANVLLHNEPGVRLVAKLTDFGLAVAAPDDTVAGGWLTAETGTYRWMAPEVPKDSPRCPQNP